MKRWTLLLFLLLLPFTMAPRTSITPGAELLDVVLVVSRIDVESGDRVNVTGQVTNVGEDAIAEPSIGILFSGNPEPKLDVVRLGKGCETRGPGGVHCMLRALKPGQQATFSFSLRLHAGDVTLTAAPFGTTAAGSSDPVTITVAPPAGDRS